MIMETRQLRYTFGDLGGKVGEESIVIFPRCTGLLLDIINHKSYIGSSV